MILFAWKKDVFARIVLFWLTLGYTSGYKIGDVLKVNRREIGNAIDPIQNEMSFEHIEELPKPQKLFGLFNFFKSRAPDPLSPIAYHLPRGAPHYPSYSEHPFGRPYRLIDDFRTKDEPVRPREAVNQYRPHVSRAVSSDGNAGVLGNQFHPSVHLSSNPHETLQTYPTTLWERIINGGSELLHMLNPLNLFNFLAHTPPSVVEHGGVYQRGYPPNYNHRYTTHDSNGYEQHFSPSKMDNPRMRSPEHQNIYKSDIKYAYPDLDYELDDSFFNRNIHSEVPRRNSYRLSKTYLNLDKLQSKVNENHDYYDMPISDSDKNTYQADDTSPVYFQGKSARNPQPPPNYDPRNKQGQITYNQIFADSKEVSQFHNAVNMHAPSNVQIDTEVPKDKHKLSYITDHNLRSDIYIGKDGNLYVRPDGES